VVTVEFIYDQNCPNVTDARAVLLRGFAAACLTPRWREWERTAADSPTRVRSFGSPTILVNGRDVAESVANDAACCRLYTDETGRACGTPSIERIIAALNTAGDVQANAFTSKDKKKGLSFMSVLPAVGAGLLPKLTCPACWPAYAGLLSAMGLGFINYSAYMLPLTVVFLVVVLGTLGFRARQRRGYGPLALGLVSSVALLIGKFGFDSDAATYAGVALLVGASLWNSWPRKLSTSCEVGGSGVNR